MTEFIYRYRWIIVLSSMAIGLGSAILIPGTRVDPEIRNYIPQNMLSRTETNKIEEEFGVQDLVMILFSDTSVITNDNLVSIKDIDRSISRISGVGSRISPFTVRSIRSEDGMMVAEPLIKSIPGDKEDLSLLGKAILQNRFANGIVVSSDLTSASITATISNGSREMETLHKIDSVTDTYAGNMKILKGGLPFIRQSLSTDVIKDGILLVPAALIIMLLVLKVNLGSWRFVMMPFSVVLLSTVFSVALIPLLGWKMSIITLLLPVMLIAVANNYGIYIVARFQELNNQKEVVSKLSLIKSLFKSLNKPVIFSGLTTVAGILGLLAHSIIPARQVGLLAASGVTLALLFSLLLIPAIIMVSGKWVARGNVGNKSTIILNRILSKIAGLIIKYPLRILIISASVMIIVSSGIVFLKVNTNQESYFSGDHPVRQASDLINSKFGGSQTISIMVSGNIKSPEVMAGIDNLTNRLKEVNGVGEVFSISQVVREMSKAIFTSTEYGYNSIPDSEEAIAQMFELYNMSGDENDFSQLMNLQISRAHVLIRLSEPEKAVITSIKELIARLTVNFPAEVSVGGYAIIMDDFADSIIRGQAASLIFAVIAVVLLLTIIFRSFLGGLIGSIPLVASIFVLFGFMGYTGISLDAATALLSSVMIGVGVDFTIQYIWCFNTQVKKGLTFPEATITAINTIGRSIIINAFSVMAGFSALMLSGFTSIRFFGYLVVISIGSCLIGAIVVIPAFLVTFRPRFIGFETGKPRIGRNEKINDVIGSTNAAFSGSGTT